MSLLTLSGRANLYDVQKLRAPKGSGALEVTNSLVEVNDLISDLDALPANAGMFHAGVRVSSLPSGAQVSIGETWGSSKSERTPYVVELATVKDSWECPVDVLKSDGQEVSQALVRDERTNHIEGNSQVWCNLILRGTATPTTKGLVGLLQMERYKDITDGFCFDVGGSGSYLRHALMVCPGASRIHMLYNPAHPTIGIGFEDTTQKPHGTYKVDPNDSTKHNYWVIHEYEIGGGVAVRDERAFKVLANIPTDTDDYPGAAVVEAAMRARLFHNIYQNRPWFLYVDPKVYTELVISTNDKLKVYTSDKNIYQTDMDMIGPNIIIRRMDALKPLTGTGETRIT